MRAPIWHAARLPCVARLCEASGRAQETLAHVAHIRPPTTKSLVRTRGLARGLRPMTGALPELLSVAEMGRADAAAIAAGVPGEQLIGSGRERYRRRDQGALGALSSRGALRTRQ